MILLRLVVGLLFAAHGTQKLFGWFGGGGPAGTGEMFESIGLRPGRPNAIAAGAAEAGGGALLASGVATPLASATLSGVMLTAVRHVHWAKGPWNTEGGYEYNLVLLAALFALTAESDGLPWAAGALAAGAAGSAAASELARRTAVPEAGLETVEDVAPVAESERAPSPS